MDIIVPLFGDNIHFNLYLSDITNILQLNSGLMDLEASYNAADRALIRTTIFGLATSLLTDKDQSIDLEELTPRETKELIMKTIEYDYYVMQYTLGWLVIIGSVNKLDHMRDLGMAYATCQRIISDLREIDDPDSCNICRCYSHNELVLAFQENITILMKGSSTSDLREHYKGMISEFKSMLNSS